MALLCKESRSEARLAFAGIELAKVRAGLREDGYVVMKKMLSREVIRLGQKTVFEIVGDLANKLEADGMITDTHSRAAGGTRLALLAEECSASCQTRFQQELHNKNMFDLLLHSDMLDLGISLMDTDEVRLSPGYHIDAMLPGGGSAATGGEGYTGWFQDGGVDDAGEAVGSLTAENAEEAYGDPTKSTGTFCAWTFMSPLVDEGASIELFKGSHVLGYQPHSTVSGGTQLAEIPAECGTDGTSSVTVRFNPGDVLLYSPYLIHRRSQHKDNGQVGWSCSWMYSSTERPTHRPDEGHIVRSLIDLTTEVQTEEEWASLGKR